MSRPLRIEYKDAWYHVMNRGRNREQIFRDKEDYRIFKDVLIETCEMWNFRISAYCLMPTHYHLLVQTPDANISRGMRHLNGVYTQRINRRHDLEGPLFRGRYKSILVEGDAYLLQIVRYIHLNPVKGGLVKSPEKYEWSSHQGYLSSAKKWNWLNRQFILNILSCEKRKWLGSYKRFMADEETWQVEEGNYFDIAEQKKWPVGFGSSEFINKIKGDYYTSKLNDEVPDSKALALDSDTIIQSICAFYKINKEELTISKRGHYNEPRNVTVYLLRKMRHDDLGTIGRFFNIKKYYTVSSIVARMKERINNDKTLKKRVGLIIDMIRKCQEKT